tara:strand:- start:27902 stop:29299 length:1398 start_codon:yes stop_codon:yes gene_type:complete
MNIKFGTDGWRAIIAKEFTVDNVLRVAEATALWLKNNGENHTVVVGHDCRFGGEMFAQATSMALASAGYKVVLAKDFVSTPMVSLGTVEYGATLGIVLTASHNPPAYNGYKIKAHFGGPMLPDQIAEVEALIPEKSKFTYSDEAFEALVKEGKIVYKDLEQLYIDAVEKTFDIQAIKDSGLRLAYDAMYGAGQNVVKRLFPDATFLHCDNNPSFMGQAPEPIHKNLLELSNLIKTRGDIDCALATDGDADRIGLYNSKGEFVDSHHIILLLIKYLVEHKKYGGKVVAAFSTSVKIEKMCKHFGLEHEVVKIGFKYICGHMVKEDVLLGGEESGGIAIKGHIPERDGIWMGLVIWEYMAKTGKSLEALIDEVYALVGTFAFHRNDLHLSEAQKQAALDKCAAGLESFGEYKVVKEDQTDGFKYFINDDEWIMIRPSGTEPVLRTYAEAATLDKAKAMLDACKATIV